MSKVVEFPKSKIVREAPVNVEQIEKAKEKGLLNFGDGIVDDLIGNIYSELDNYGLDTTGENFDKDFSFAMDGLRACVFRVLGLKHHLHSFLDTNVTMKKLQDIRMELENETAKMDLDLELELEMEESEEENDTDRP